MKDSVAQRLWHRAMCFAILFFVGFQEALASEERHQTSNSDGDAGTVSSGLALCCILSWSWSSHLVVFGYSGSCSIDWQDFKSQSFIQLAAPPYHHWQSSWLDERSRGGWWWHLCHNKEYCKSHCQTLLDCGTFLPPMLSFVCHVLFSLVYSWVWRLDEWRSGRGWDEEALYQDFFKQYCESHQ